MEIDQCTIHKMSTNVNFARTTVIPPPIPWTVSLDHSVRISYDQVIDRKLYNLGIAGVYLLTKQTMYKV